MQDNDRTMKACHLLLFCVTLPALAQPTGVKALVGGTLIDGYGGAPIRNSVILIEGERIAKVGRARTIPIPPGPETTSTARITLLPAQTAMHPAPTTHG